MLKVPDSGGGRGAHARRQRKPAGAGFQVTSDELGAERRLPRDFAGMTHPLLGLTFGQRYRGVVQRSHHRGQEYQFRFQRGLFAQFAIGEIVALEIRQQGSQLLAVLLGIRSAAQRLARQLRQALLTMFSVERIEEQRADGCGGVGAAGQMGPHRRAAGEQCGIDLRSRDTIFEHSQFLRFATD